MDGDRRELGDRVRGILFSGAGESDRPLSVFSGAVEDDPGGHHAGGVLRVFGLVSEGAAEVELSGRLRPDGRSCVRDFQGMVRRREELWRMANGKKDVPTLAINHKPHALSRQGSGVALPPVIEAE
jgi:hypothetical protein